MRPFLGLILCGSVVLSILACAPAVQRQQVYIAPTDRTITARLEASYDGRGQHVVVINGSTVEIVVTSLHLRQCENIKNRCEVQRLRVPVKPGRQVRIAMVQVENQARASNFRYSWTWELAAPTEEPAR